MSPSFPLEISQLVPQKMFPLWPYNKSLIVQACSVKMAKNWPRFFNGCFTDLGFLYFFSFYGPRRTWPGSNLNRTSHTVARKTNESHVERFSV